MKTVFVDANVFIRFFAGDDAKQRAMASGLLRKAAAGRVALISGPPVLFEVAWTLRTTYRQPREEVLAMLSAIASHPGLTLTDAAMLQTALARAKESGQEFADSYIAASADAGGADAVATFNLKDFRKLGAPLYRL